MAGDLVSVLMPAFNGDRFLGAAIESVLAQSHRQWELIVVDDGSSDATLVTARGYAQRDARITVLQHAGGANRGVSASRNRAFSASSGKLIAFLDSDDLWCPHKLAHQIDQYRTHHDVVMLYGNAVTIDEQSVENRVSQRYQFVNICGSGLKGVSGDLTEAIIMNRVWLPMSTVVVARHALQRSGGFSLQFAYQIEDQYLWTLIAQYGSVFYDDEVLAHYRLHPHSYTITQPWHRSYLEYYQALYRVLPEHRRPTVRAGLKAHLGSLLARRRLSVSDLVYLLRCLRGLALLR